MYYNVKDYGADGIAAIARQIELEINEHIDWIYPKGIVRDVYDRCSDNSTLDCVGIQRAIDAAHVAGGGTVFVPAGDYLISSVQLKSFVTLHLDNGARLWGSPVLSDYEVTEGDDSAPPNLFDQVSGAGLPKARPPIKKLVWAHGAESTGIRGPGIIDAQGYAFVIPWLNSNRAADHRLRPRDMFSLYGCKNLKLTDFTIRNSTWWTMGIHSSNNVMIQGVTLNCFDGPQVDGIDLVDSQNVTISDCLIHTADDAICLKNNKADQVLKNITVTNCVIRTICNAIKLGTNSSGVFENMRFSNIIIHNPEGDTKRAEAAICLSSVDGGVFRQIYFDGIQSRGPTCPFYIIGGNRPLNQPTGESAPGRIEDVGISNSSFYGVSEPALVVAHPEAPFKRIDLNNVCISDDAEALAHPEASFEYDPETYPRPSMYGVAPASSLYVRNVEGFSLVDGRLEGPWSEQRPNLRMERVQCTTATDAMSASPV